MKKNGDTPSATLKLWCLQQKTPIGTRLPCCKKKKRVTRGFAGTIFVLALQMKQHDLDFPTRENGKTNELYYFLFIRSGLYSSRNVTFIVSVISKETS